MKRFRRLGAALTLLGCEEMSELGTVGSSVVEPSPNASILPSPLASVAPSPLTDAGRGPISDADASVDAEPKPFPAYGSLATDTLLPGDGTGLTLDAQLLWYPWDPGGAPEPSARHRVLIQLSSQGRMRLVSDSEQLHLEPGTELRARTDQLGLLMVWSERSAYRVVQRGALRALLQERRPDVAPFLEAKLQDTIPDNALAAGPRSTLVETQLGTLKLEQTKAGNLAGAGSLLCRLLVELVLADVHETVCIDDWLPVRADYHWTGGGRFGFVTTATTRATDLNSNDFLIPPEGAILRSREIPPISPRVRIDEDELARLVPQAAPPSKDPEAGAPNSGLVIESRYDTPRYLSLNGTLVAWLPALGQVHLKSLKAGSYELFVRDFLGTEAPLRQAVRVPGRAQLGSAANGDRTPSP